MALFCRKFQIGLFTHFLCYFFRAKKGLVLIYTLFATLLISQNHISYVSTRWLTHGVTDGHPDPKIGPQVYLGPTKIIFGLKLSKF